MKSNRVKRITIKKEVRLPGTNIILEQGDVIEVYPKEDEWEEDEWSEDEWSEDEWKEDESEDKEEKESGVTDIEKKERRSRGIGDSVRFSEWWKKRREALKNEVSDRLRKRAEIREKIRKIIENRKKVDKEG